MNENKIVLDTNIFFSFLLHRVTARRRLFQTDPLNCFYCPRFFLVELFKQKERIAQISELDPEELLECFYELLARIHLSKKALSLSENGWRLDAFART